MTGSSATTNCHRTHTPLYQEQHPPQGQVNYERKGKVTAQESRDRHIPPALTVASPSLEPALVTGSPAHTLPAFWADWSCEALDGAQCWGRWRGKSSLKSDFHSDRSKNATCSGLCHPPSTPESMYYCLSHFTGVVTVHRGASTSPSVAQWEVVKQCLNPGVWSQSLCSSTALLPHQGGLWPTCLKLHPEVGMFLRNNVLSAVSGPVFPGHISRADPHEPSLKAI